MMCMVKDLVPTLATGIFQIQDRLPLRSAARFVLSVIIKLYTMSKIKSWHHASPHNVGQYRLIMKKSEIKSAGNF